MTTITGSWNETANAWVSEELCLQTGDIWLEVTLPAKGYIVIKKSETSDGPWPKALISTYSGPEFRVRIYGSTKERYIRIETTSTPNTIQYANI